MFGTLLAVLSDSLYVVLAGAAGRWLRNRRWMGKVSGLVYIGLGVTAART